MAAAAAAGGSRRGVADVECLSTSLQLYSALHTLYILYTLPQGGGRRRQHQQPGAQDAYQLPGSTPPSGPQLGQRRQEQAQAANGLLASAPVRSGGCPRRLALRTGGPLHPSRTDHVVLTHNSLLFLSCGIACHVRPRCVLVWYRFVLRERFLAIPNKFCFCLTATSNSIKVAGLRRTWSALGVQSSASHPGPGS